MFLQKGNTFFPEGDGGFINYSYNSDGSCTHTDGKIRSNGAQSPSSQTRRHWITD